jgi:hypothetical protein
MGNRGKLTTALTYAMTIAVGVVFAYFTILSGGSLLLVFGGIFLVVLGAVLLWADFFRRQRVKS